MKKLRILEKLKFLVDYQFKIGAIIFSTFVILLIFAGSFYNYKTADTTPEFSLLTRKEQRELGPFSTKVRAGLYVKEFPKFDVINNNFIMDAVVWFEYDPTSLTLENIGKFSFLDGSIKKKSEPDVKMIKDRVFVKYEVIVEIRSDLSFKYYPYDYHILPIFLTNNYISTSGMVFITADENFNIDRSLKLSNWAIDDITTDYGYRRASFDKIDENKHLEYPLALFTLTFSSMGIKDALIIFIPILFSILLGLFSLFIPLVYGELNVLGQAFSTVDRKSVV